MKAAALAAHTMLLPGGCSAGLASQTGEFQAGTDPFDLDSDNDDLDDGAEVAAGTNPLQRDSDGDLVSDGLEVMAASAPLDALGVNLGPVLDSLSVTPANLGIEVKRVLGRGLVGDGAYRRGCRRWGHRDGGAMIVGATPPARGVGGAP